MTSETRPRRKHEAGRLQPASALLAAAAPIVAIVPWIGVLAGDWLVVAIVMVVTMAIASAVARSLTRTPIGTIAAGVLAVAWCTWVGARDEAFLGIVPTPAALDRIAQLVAEGVYDVLWTPVPPVPASEGLTLVVLLAIAVLALAIDVLVLVAGMPAFAIGLMLLPVVLPMAYYVEVAPTTLVPAAIVAAALLLTRRRPRPQRVAPGIVAVAAVAACAIVAPLALPAPRAVDVGWQSWFQLGGTTGPGDAVVLSTGIDLAADLARGDPVPVLEYTPSDGLPLRTRLTSLQGVSDSGFVETIGELGTDFSDLGGGGPGDEITTEIELLGAAVGNAPLPEQPLATDDFAGDWRWDPATQSIGFDDRARLVLLDDVVYEATSIRPPTTLPEGQVASTGHDDERVVPDAAAGVAALVDDIVDMSAPPAERAAQLYAFLTDASWQYSEDVPFDGFGTTGGGGWAVLEAFMAERVGYCVHYATAMALLARAADIPARVTVGFLPGEDPNGDGTYTVTTNDMHAWAELWFDGLGWVPFDTTPAIAAGGSVSSAPDDVETGASEQPVLPTPTPTPTPSSSPEEPSATPTPSASADGQGDDGADASPVPDVEPLPPPVWLWWLVVPVLLATPALVRLLVRRIRVRAGPGGAWEEVQASLADAGTRVRRSATPGGLEAAVRAHSVLEPGALEALQRLRRGAEAAAFGFAEARAGAGDDAAQRSRDVALVRRAIHRQESWGTRLARTLAPSSLVRLWARDARLEEGTSALR